MIVYMVTAQHRYTIDSYIGRWIPRLRKRLLVLEYDSLPFVGRLPGATYIFSDVERLSGPMLEIATDVWKQLDNRGMRLLNHPARSFRRRQLLDALHERGRSRFRVAAVADACSLRKPIFIRMQNEHTGNLTDLLHDDARIAEEISRLRSDGVRDEELLAVEFCDTRDRRGIFRKFSAFSLGGEIVPRHLMHGHTWALKKADIIDDRTVAEERKYVHSNPHRRPLEKIFDMAGIAYGRVDYSLLKGRIQVWEINTNPMIVENPDVYAKKRLPLQKQFAHRMFEFLRSLDDGAAGSSVPISIDDGLAAQVLADKYPAPMEDWSGAAPTDPA